MEPRIQYATTSDRVSIACWAMGEGRPLVHMPGLPWSHIGLEWQSTQWRHWYERLSETKRLIRYDSRGTGLSDREASDYSLDALVLDLEAVVDRLRLDRFALFGPYDSGPVAVAYAVRHPERVSHLILWLSWARGRDVYESPQLRAVQALLDEDWVVYTETLSRVVLGWAEGEGARGAAEFLRECVAPETARAAHRAVRAFDVTDLLSHVQQPTLVLHRRAVPWAPERVAQAVASRIPNARLAVVDGTSPVPFVGDMESVLRITAEFLGEEYRAPTSSETAAPMEPFGVTTTILFTDMEDSTAATQRLGDARAQELLQNHNTIVRDALKAHGGHEIKHTGDGIMASFSTSSRALECAVYIQELLVSSGAGSGDAVRVRIGLNAGEPVMEGGDLFGTAVQLARRVCDAAQPGQILVSDVVRQLAAGKGFLFSDIGEVVLKGFEDPSRLHEVRWRQSGSNE